MAGPYTAVGVLKDDAPTTVYGMAITAQKPRTNAQIIDMPNTNTPPAGGGISVS